MSDKINALATFLNVDPDDIEQSDYNEEMFEFGREEYLVLTDEEADLRAKESISDSLWSFNASFLADQTGLDDRVFTALQPLCENANDAILSIVEKFDGIDSFVKEAISADGRGHFLADYDFEEHEVEFDGETFWIYRVN